MSKFSFGIDVGGTTIKCGFFTADGELLEKWEIVTRKENGGDQILPDIAHTIHAKMLEKGIDKTNVAGIGVGVPGAVNLKGEIPVAVNLGWGYKHITKELKELTGMPVKAGNDATVAALGEAWRGAAAGSLNVVLVTLGTGVGGGIIVDGRILAGAHGAAGEVGHMNIDTKEEESCNCGNKGCLEQSASATGIARLARKALAESEKESVLRRLERVSAKNVFDAYKEKDELAMEIVDEFAERLGRGLAAIADVVDPEVILIGGGVSKAGQVLVDAVAPYYAKYTFVPCKDTPIRLAELGNDAGIYGAAKLVVQG